MWGDAYTGADEADGQEVIEKADDIDYGMWFTKRKKENIGAVRIIDEIKRPKQSPRGDCWSRSMRSMGSMTTPG